MESILAGVNIVILASNYNPSIISKDWLRDKGIITEEPLNFAHTPVFSMVQSENFLLTVDDRRLTLSIRNISDLNLHKLPEIVNLYVESLKETPYKALGFNFKWIIRGEDGNFPINLKEDYISPKKRESLEKLCGEFSIGSIIYIPYNEKFLLKIIIDPNLKKKTDLELSFNYHADVTNVNLMIEEINKFPQLLKHSKEMADNLFNKEVTNEAA